jgi:hypothetical protein
MKEELETNKNNDGILFEPKYAVINLSVNLDTPEESETKIWLKNTEEEAKVIYKETIDNIKEVYSSGKILEGENKTILKGDVYVDVVKVEKVDPFMYIDVSPDEKFKEYEIKT